MLGHSIKMPSTCKHLLQTTITTTTNNKPSEYGFKCAKESITPCVLSLEKTLNNFDVRLEDVVVDLNSSPSRCGSVPIGKLVSDKDFFIVDSVNDCAIYDMVRQCPDNYDSCDDEKAIYKVFDHNVSNHGKPFPKIIEKQQDVGDSNIIEVVQQEPSSSFKSECSGKDAVAAEKIDKLEKVRI